MRATNIYFWYNNLQYLKKKLDQPILYLMHFNSTEIVLRSNERYTEVHLIELKKKITSKKYGVQVL